MDTIESNPTVRSITFLGGSHMKIVESNPKAKWFVWWPFIIRVLSFSKEFVSESN